MTTLRRRGFVLLAVLWVMVGVIAIGLGLALVARRAVGSARNRRTITIAMWDAEDCLARAESVIAAVLEQQTDKAAQGARVGAETWATLDRAVRSALPAGKAQCSVMMVPTGSTIDVNTASDELLRHFFGALGIAPARVDTLVDALLDWRDADDSARPHGAETAWYIGHGRAPPRNGPLADVRELTRVRGFEVSAGVDSLLGVEPGRIMLDRAPLPVIAALPGFTEEALARVAEHRVRGTPIPDLLNFSAELSATARGALLARYPDLVRLTTAEPDAWILTALGVAGAPTVTVVLEVRLVRAGSRAAVVRRSTWVK